MQMAFLILGVLLALLGAAWEPEGFGILAIDADGRLIAWACGRKAAPV